MSRFIEVSDAQYAKIQGLAERIGVTSLEAISMALQALAETADEVEAGVDADEAASPPMISSNAVRSRSKSLSPCASPSRCELARERASIAVST